MTARPLAKPACVAGMVAALAVAGANRAAAQAMPAPAPAPALARSAMTVPSPAAVIEAMPKNLPRAKGPALGPATDAALAAQRACTAKGVKVSVLVADVLGQPVVLLSGEGAGVRSALIARTKANIVAKFGMPSGEVEQRAKADPSLAARAAADPEIGVLRGGGFPVIRDGNTIGIVAVSGGSLGGVMGLDEACAQVAVKMLEGR